jgi:hypothetical protein
MSRLLSVFISLAMLCFTGCAVSIGPQTVVRDRFAYTDAVSDSWKTQMLLNMVKIRYADSPIFLDISSIISQRLVEAEFQGNISWNAFLPTDSQTLGGRGKYSDRPTITYQPLIGEKFARSLMTPIQPAVILSLIQSGRPADIVFRLCVQSVNGIHNRVGGRIRTRQADPDFYRLIDSLRKIQDDMSVGMRVGETEDHKHATLMSFHKKDIEPEIVAEIDSLKELLSLNPELQEFKVSYGMLPKDDQEIAMLSRSMLEIIQELASYIEVPETHVAEQRTTPTLADDTAVSDALPPLLRIQSNSEEPADAFVAVRYLDHWFWIDDRDFNSKKIFSFIMFLFSLAETGPSKPAPVITVPTG